MQVYNHWTVVIVARAIRKSLLVHSVTYERFAGNGRTGPEFDAPVTVDFVRVEPKRSVIIDTNQKQLVSTSLLMIDRVHSSVADWVEESKVTFEGKTYRIKALKTFYADRNIVHHWEAILV